MTPGHLLLDFTLANVNILNCLFNQNIVFFLII
jgi:hypothetical protein